MDVVSWEGIERSTNPAHHASGPFLRPPGPGRPAFDDASAADARTSLWEDWAEPGRPAPNADCVSDAEMRQAPHRKASRGRDAMVTHEMFEGLLGDSGPQKKRAKTQPPPM